MTALRRLSRALTTDEPDVPVVRKSDLDAALGGERDE